MRIKNVVKVMNFHSLLRIEASKKEASHYQNVGDEITNIIRSILYNRNLVLDKKIITPNPENPKLNIYIANDYGFCGNFNSQVAHQIRQDKDDYKIIIGKKIIYNDDKTLLKIEKDNFNNELGRIEKTIDDSIHNASYSEINLYYNHYNSSTSFEFKKLNLYPLKFEGDYYSNKDFVIETDITSMIYSLLTFYIMYQLRMCECISRAAENTIRNQITREAIDKIEQIEEEQENELRKEKKTILINKTVDNYKKLSYMEADNG